MKNRLLFYCVFCFLAVFFFSACDRQRADRELFLRSAEQVQAYAEKLLASGVPEELREALQSNSFHIDFSIGLSDMRYYGNPVFQDEAPRLLGQIRRGKKDAAVLASLQFSVPGETAAFRLISAEQRPYFYFPELSTRYIALSDLLIGEASLLERALFDLFVYREGRDELLRTLCKNADFSSAFAGEDGGEAVSMRLDAEDAEILYGKMLALAYQGKRIPQVLRDYRVGESFQSAALTFVLRGDTVVSGSLEVIFKSGCFLCADIRLDENGAEFTGKTRLSSMELELDGYCSASESETGKGAVFSVHTMKRFDNDRYQKAEVTLTSSFQAERGSNTHSLNFSLYREDETGASRLWIPLDITTVVSGGIITQRLFSESASGILQYRATGDITIALTGEDRMDLPDLHLALPLAEEGIESLKTAALDKYPAMMQAFYPEDFENLMYHMFEGGPTLRLENKAKGEMITLYGKDGSLVLTHGFQYTKDETTLYLGYLFGHNETTAYSIHDNGAGGEYWMVGKKKFFYEADGERILLKAEDRSTILELYPESGTGRIKQFAAFEIRGDTVIFRNDSASTANTLTTDGTYYYLNKSAYEYDFTDELTPVFQ